MVDTRTAVALRTCRRAARSVGRRHIVRCGVASAGTALAIVWRMAHVPRRGTVSITRRHDLAAEL